MRLRVCVATVAACLSVACHRAPDTKDTLRKALDQANMHQVDVKVDDTERIVHLQGTVGSMSDRPWILNPRGVCAPESMITTARRPSSWSRCASM